MSKNSKKKHLENHKKFAIGSGYVAKEYSKKYSNIKHVLTVGELKELLSKVEDDTIPVTIEVFEDAYTSREYPMYYGSKVTYSLFDGDVSCDSFAIRTVENKHYKEWDEQN